MFPIEGWLLNKDLKTNHYMIIWTNLRYDKERWTSEDIGKIEVDDFTIVEAMLINKEKIINYLNDNHWPKNRIYEYSRMLREQHLINKQSMPGMKDFCFYYTDSLAEQPINILIKKTKLRDLASAHYFISKKEYRENKEKGKTEIWIEYSNMMKRIQSV